MKRKEDNYSELRIVGYVAHFIEVDEIVQKLLSIPRDRPYRVKLRDKK